MENIWTNFIWQNIYKNSSLVRVFLFFLYVVRIVNELGEAFDEITNLVDNLITVTKLLQEDK